MHTVNGHLIVLLGGDGAGKSSVLRRLREVRPGWSYASIDPADLYPLPGLNYMDWAATTPPRTYIGVWEPLSRASFLAHVLSLCYEERILPELARGNTVICDSYYYRIWAKEQMLSSPGSELVAALGRLMRRPDLALWLDVDTATAWQRSGMRCEAYEAVGDRSYEGFLRMQEGVRRLVLDELAAGPLRHIDASRPVEDIAAEVIREISAVAAPSLTRAGR
jgi:thymidylate kinase